jgi:hypothetical protein
MTRFNIPAQGRVPAHLAGVAGRLETPRRAVNRGLVTDSLDVGSKRAPDGRVRLHLKNVAPARANGVPLCIVPDDTTAIGDRTIFPVGLRLVELFRWIRRTTPTLSGAFSFPFIPVSESVSNLAPVSSSIFAHPIICNSSNSFQWQTPNHFHVQLSMFNIFSAPYIISRDGLYYPHVSLTGGYNDGTFAANWQSIDASHGFVGVATVYGEPINLYGDVDEITADFSID